MFFSNIFKKNKKNIEKDTKEVKNQVENYNEYDVCNYFIEELIKLGKDDTLFRIEQRSDRYLSLIYGNNNFLRVHISKVDDTKWITIAMFNSYRKKYIDSELFLAQTNKNQIHWKADIQDFNDLKKIGVVLKRAIYFITCNGHMMYNIKIDQDYITNCIIDSKDLRKIYDLEHHNTYKQLSFFDDNYNYKI